jgi:predicted RNA-binding Zn ribbon-like protein
MTNDGHDSRQITVGAHTFSVRGGWLCLDFVNTVDNWFGPRAADGIAPLSDYLAGYADLLAWARQVGAVSEGTAGNLATIAAEHPADAARIFRRAIVFRSALHDLVRGSAEARAAGLNTERQDLATLNTEIQPLLAASRLEPAGAGYALARPGESDPAALSASLEAVLWPVVRSALALLTSPADLAAVGACAGENCGWLFHDPAGRRRWCSMAVCGTRHKVRRFRARQRSEAPA